MRLLNLRLTEAQFQALWGTLAGRVEDAEIAWDPDNPDPTLKEDLELRPLVEAMDAMTAHGRQTLDFG